MSTLARVVHWHRAPAACALPWVDASMPLPRDVRQVLQAANGDPTAMTLGAAAVGCAASDVRAAALRFVREVLLAAGSDHYRRLGTNPDATPDDIRANYRELISLFHPDRGAGGGDPALAAAVNEAYNTLKRAGARAKYDRTRDAAKAIPASAARTPASPAPKRAERRRRPRWQAQRAPVRALVWLRSQAPARLQALAFASLLGGALLAVLIAGARPAATVLAMRAEEPVAVPARGAEAMPALRLAVAADAAPKREPPTPRANAGSPDRVAIAGREAAAIANVMARSHTTMAVRDALAKAPPAASPGETLPSGDAAIREPRMESAERRAPEPVSPATAPEAGPSLPPAQAIEPRSPAIAAADVELLIARFVSAYDRGDLAALTALVDPDAAQGERMTQTLASFGRVFQGSVSRRLDLRVIATDSVRGRVELAMRTTLTDAAHVRRTSVGTLTLKVRQRGTVPVITDLESREVDAG